MGLTSCGSLFEHANSAEQGEAGGRTKKFLHVRTFTLRQLELIFVVHELVDRESARGQTHTTFSIQGESVPVVLWRAANKTRTMSDAKDSAALKPHSADRSGRTARTATLLEASNPMTGLACRSAGLASRLIFPVPWPSAKAPPWGPRSKRRNGR